MNGAYGSTSYVQSVDEAVKKAVELAPDLVISTGDMVAGQKAGLNYAAMWKAFHETVTDPLALAGIPFAPTPGNHDASGSPGFANERAVYTAQWTARKPKVDFLDDSGYPFRYSFARGPALFISLDATTVGPLSSEQKRWVESQLVAGAAFPVKIVYGHVPLYAFTHGRETETLKDPAFETMLKDHGVTMFISGHHHGYYPGKRTSLRLVSTSCLGDGPRPLIGTSTASKRSFLVLEMDGERITSLEAFGEPSFTTPIARSSLPVSLTYGGNTVLRDDQ
jgi:3',5'-cyclic AMP phosphodiesterase CpdA